MRLASRRARLPFLSATSNERVSDRGSQVFATVARALDVEALGRRDGSARRTVALKCCRRDAFAAAAADREARALRLLHAGGRCETVAVLLESLVWRGAARGRFQLHVDVRVLPDALGRETPIHRSKDARRDARSSENEPRRERRARLTLVQT